MFRAANEAGTFARAVKTIGLPDHSQGLTALQTGTIEVYATDEPILYEIARDPSQFRIVPLKMNATAQTLLIRPGSSKFKRIADQTIAQLCSSGEWEKLYQRYFGDGGFKIPLSDLPWEAGAGADELPGRPEVHATSRLRPSRKTLPDRHAPRS